MYELLLKWGLDSLTKLTGDRSARDLSIMLEAVRTKNALVVARFNHAWDASQAIVDLAVQVDEDLVGFQASAPKTDGSEEGASKYLAELRQDFHPRYYRRLVKVRSRFESTNDLLSAYSTAMTEVVHFGMLEQIVEAKGTRSSGAINRTYRGLWTMYADLMTRLIRLTSNDLRFWLTDQPFIIDAEEWVKGDVATVKEFLLAKDWGGKRFHLSLETEEGLAGFWEAIARDSS